MSSKQIKTIDLYRLLNPLVFSLFILFLSNAGRATGKVFAMQTFQEISSFPSFRYSITEGPILLIHPVSQTECYYRTVSFFVKASGENLRYAWERKLPGGEFALIPEGDIKVTYPSPGFITIKDVGTAANPDGTEFRAIVSDGSSSVVSQSAVLTINRITGVLASTDPSNATSIQLCAGSEFSWSVITNYPENVTSYQWMKYHGPNDWRPVLDDECISGSQTGQIHFSGVRSDHSGRYYVSIHFRSSAEAGCTVSSQSNFSRQIEVYIPPAMELACPITEPYYPPNDTGYYLGDFSVVAINECGPVELVYIIDNVAIEFPYLFESGTTSVEVFARDIPEKGLLCSYSVNVGDQSPPDFQVPEEPYRFCQTLPELVVFGEFGIVLESKYNDVILNGPELSVFDLDPTVFAWNDNLCPVDELVLHWIIEFSTVADPLNPDLAVNANPVSGTGQPSESNMEICLPGGSAGTGMTGHIISYWMEDCHGNISDSKCVPIIILSRPGIVMSTGYP